jgi:ferric-dicitrate binding protein FerR (iron transport regulator)
VYEADSRDISVVKADIDVATSWRDGKLVFHNTSFDDALKMLSKRFDVDFEVKNKKYSAVSLTGVISNQHLDRVLEYISMTANMKFRCVESDDVELERQRIVIY